MYLVPILIIIKTAVSVTTMAFFIYINGFPGVGKLTIAQELQGIIPNAKIFHNHLIIDPVAALVDRDSPEYLPIRTNLRRHVLDIIATAESTKGMTWIFTDCRLSDSIGSEAAQDYKAAAERRRVVFIPVVLNCDLKENLKRAVTETRSTRTKLMDPVLVESIRQNVFLYHFGMKEELEIDITELSALQAAQRISQHLDQFEG